MILYAEKIHPSRKQILHRASVQDIMQRSRLCSAFQIHIKYNLIVKIGNNALSNVFGCSSLHVDENIATHLMFLPGVGIGVNQNDLSSVTFSVDLNWELSRALPGTRLLGLKLSFFPYNITSCPHTVTLGMRVWCPLFLLN